VSLPQELDASVEAPVACFPKFVRYSRPHFRELRKAEGNCNLFDSSAAYDFEVPERIRGKLCRNFKIGGAGTTRLRRPQHARSSRALSRPSHSAPNVRDDREAPLLAGPERAKNDH
jgi:hypothetical protein